MHKLKKYLFLACLAAGLALAPAAAHAEDAAAAAPVAADAAEKPRKHKYPDFDSPDFNKEEFCTKVKARHAERKAKMEEKKAAYEELKAKDPEAAAKMKQEWQAKREKKKAKYGEKGKDGKAGKGKHGKHGKAEKIRELCGIEPLKRKQDVKAPEGDTTTE